MGVVLLANEMGAGLGHITRLMPVARALKDRGHQPVIAVHDIVGAAPATNGEQLPVVEAPSWRGRCYPKSATRTFACILADRGFARPDVLAPTMSGWLSLLELITPDLIVVDHSPTLCAAAHGTVQVVAVGDGFTLPPCDGDMFPPLRTDVPPVLPEAEILKAVQQTQRNLGVTPFDSLPQIFSKAHRFIVNMPETDPYAAYRTEPVHGPLQPPPALQPLPASGGFYGYFYAGHPLVGKLLPLLAEARISGSMFIHQATSEQRQAVSKLGFTVYGEPQPLDKVLGEARLVIHHGGAGVTAAALSVGRPQLLMPRYLEQRLTGAALSRIGVGASFPEKSKLEAIVHAAKIALSQEAVGARAQTVAEQIRVRGPYDTLSKIVACCLSVLESGTQGASKRLDEAVFEKSGLTEGVRKDNKTG